MTKNYSGIKKRIVSLFLLFLITISIFGLNTSALQTTISVSDGTIGDWRGVPRFNDSLGDANGVGPNDLTRFFVTNDATNIYVRWDVILSGPTTKAKSCSYGVAITSQIPAGTTRPSFEAMAYVSFDAQGNVKTIEIENGTKEVVLPVTYAEQISTGTTLSTVSIEAKFPFADFNNNGMTVNPLNANTLFPVWGCSLQAAVYNSVQVDTVPDAGFLKYDSATSTTTPIGTGPVASLTTLATNPYVVANANVYYYATIKNVGDGTSNLAFTTLKWQLPTGFTYVPGSTTGITTANPTISSGLLTWTISGSLPAGSSTALYFTATASGTAGTYYSDVDLIATTPNVTYDNGATAPVTVGANYVPMALTASSTTQTTANLSWTAFTGASKYTVYDNGIPIASGLTGTTYNVTNLTAGSTHSFYIEAFNSVNDYMDASNTASVTTVGPYNVTVLGQTTNDNTPTITGSTNAPNGTSVRITVNGQNYTGSVSNGLWSADVTAVLADNTYSVSAVILNAASNTGTGSVTVDTVAPTITVNSLTTQNRTPTITGTTNAPNGRTVTLTVNGQQYTGTVLSGAWSIAVTNSLADNTYTVSASVSDVAGNIGTNSGTLIVDNIPPTITVNSLTTNNRTPIITGNTNAPNGSTVSLTIDGKDFTGTVSSGTWSVSVTHPLGDNTYTAFASVSDAAGNTGSNTGTVIIDNVAPIITVNSLTTKNRTPTITGTTDASDGRTVTLTVNGQQYTGTVSGGAWSIAVTNSLADNTYTTSASVTDVAGNTGTNSGTLIVDNVPPTITVNSVTNNHNTPIITGSTNAPNGSTVTLTINAHQYTGTVLNGSWSIEVTDPLPDNTYTASASVSDEAGNTGTNTGTVTIDTYVKSSDANLANITVSSGSLSPSFGSQTTAYQVNVVNGVSTINVAGFVQDSKSTLKINNISVSSGTSLNDIPLAVGNNTITLVVTAEDGVTTKTYTLTVTRAKPSNLTGFELDTSNIQNSQLTLVGTNLDKLYTYQIWCYQYVVDEFTVNEGPNWVLAKAYSTAFNEDISAVGNASYTFNYDGSPFDRCKIFVRIKDLNGNVTTYVNEYSVATNTKIKINNVKINNIIQVDHALVTAGSAVNISVDAIGAQGVNTQTRYSYYINNTKIENYEDVLTSSINWLIPNTFQPGRYTLKVIAYQEGHYLDFDEKIIKLHIGNHSFAIPQLINSALEIPTITAGDNAFIRMFENNKGASDPDRTYSIQISEYFRAPFYTANQSNMHFLFQYPGMYEIFATINNVNSLVSYSDGAVRRFTVARNSEQLLKPEVKLADVTVEHNSIDETFENIKNSVNVNDVVKFEATALNSSNTSLYEYAFFREDAKGYRMIKDWGNTVDNGNFLEWTPTRPGTYTIQIRARLKEFADNASNKNFVPFEDAKSYKFDVQGYSQIVSAINITNSGDYKDANGNYYANQPINISAVCSGTNLVDHNLIYNFQSYDDDMRGITIQDYSPENSCVWIPRKAGTYTITVFVRDRDSYGYYDKLERQTFTIVNSN